MPLRNTEIKMQAEQLQKNLTSFGKGVTMPIQGMGGKNREGGAGKVTNVMGVKDQRLIQIKHNVVL